MSKMAVSCILWIYIATYESVCKRAVVARSYIFYTAPDIFRLGIQLKQSSVTIFLFLRNAYQMCKNGCILGRQKVI